MRSLVPDPLVDTLYHTYGARLRRFAEGLTHDYDQAEDLVQKAFIQATAHSGLLDQLDGPQRLAWFYKVVKNRFIDQVRASRRQQELLRSLADIAASDEPSWEHAAEVSLFERIPDRFRSLLVARYVQGLTSEEIATIMHIPAPTVRSRIRLALNWLRAHPEEWIG